MTALALWRHADPAVAVVPGVRLDGRDSAGAPPGTVAREAYEAGARRVALGEPVDLSGADPAPVLDRLALVRELTAWGLVVEWEITPTDSWPLLSHLYPPRGVRSWAPGWADGFHLDRCISRRGPDFVQVRDRRSGELNRLTIDDPDWLAALDRLRDGGPAAAVPAEVLAGYTEEDLLWPLGGLALWLPYQVRRWPWPGMLL